MASNPEGQPWRVDYGTWIRSKCRTCRRLIRANKLRLGEMALMSNFDAQIVMWNHAGCIMKKPNRIKCIDDVEGLELLRWDDQEKIKIYIRSGVNKKIPAALEFAIEVSPSSHAKCRYCKGKIMQGEVRILTKHDDPSATIIAWHHAKCFMNSSPSIDVMILDGWRSLPGSNQEAILAMAAKKRSSTKAGKKHFQHAVGEISKDSTSKIGTRRAMDNCSGQMSKRVKFEGDVSTSRK